MNGVARTVSKAMFSSDRAMDDMVDIEVSVRVDGRFVGDFVA